MTGVGQGGMGGSFRAWIINCHVISLSFIKSLTADLLLGNTNLSDSSTWGVLVIYLRYSNDTHTLHPYVVAATLVSKPWWLICSYSNRLSGFPPDFGNLATGIRSHSAVRALVRFTMNVGQQGLVHSQPSGFLTEVLDGVEVRPLKFKCQT